MASDAQPSPSNSLQQLASMALEIQRLKASRDSEDKGWRKRGRVIRRLVSLTDNIIDMIFEADRRKANTAEDGQPPNEEENRLYRNYTELMKWIPELQQWMNSTADKLELNNILKQLNGGAEAARGDDTHRLKIKVIAWISESPTSNPPLHAYCKDGRGLASDVIGRLLCPVEYNWDSPEQRDKIRSVHPDFLVTANSWPAFLYKDYTYDPNDPAKGLFKGDILWKSFKLIFTAPSSVDTEENPNGKRARAKRTRETVSQIHKMNKVTPRGIAYIAVQVRFALSNCASWTAQDSLFHFSQFYHAIIRWFEDIDGAEERAFVDDLLLWWNRKVFGLEAVLSYQPQAANSGSVAASFKKRRTNAAPAGLSKD